MKGRMIIILLLVALLVAWLATHQMSFIPSGQGGQSEQSTGRELISQAQEVVDAVNSRIP